MRALRADIIVRPDELPKTHGSLFLPDRDMPDGPVPGTVVAVGPEVDPDIKVGTRIYFNARANRRAEVFEIDGVLHSRIESADVDAALEA